MDDDSEKNIRHGKWVPEEDLALSKAVEQFGEKKWRKISELVSGRSPIQCLHRWTKILKPGLIKGAWTEEEDSQLKKWVQKYGPCKWAKCAKNITGRNGKQCRERWCNNLNPDVKKGEWDPKEDVIIFNMFQNYGPKWASIAKFLPGRTENSIKNRFYSTIRKMNNKKKETENFCMLGTSEFEKAIWPDFNFEEIPQKQEGFVGKEFLENCEAKQFFDTFSNFLAQSEFNLQPLIMKSNEMWMKFL